jgi:hypothetical protein
MGEGWSRRRAAALIGGETASPIFLAFSRANLGVADTLCLATTRARLTSYVSAVTNK